MVKITVLYGNPQDPRAFEKYYAQTHLPLAAQVSGVSRIELSKIVGTPAGMNPPYYRMAELWFDSQEQMEATMASPEAKAAVADIANFATGGATVFICQVE